MSTVARGWGFGGREADSKQLAKEYARVAEEKGVEFFDAFADGGVNCSPIDSIHFDRENHYKLGSSIAQRVLEMRAEEVLSY